MKLLITIVQRDKGEKVAELISQYKVDFSVVFLGNGTASSQMMEYFSLEDTTKDVVFSLIDNADEKVILDYLNEQFQLYENNQGIAYTVSLTSINRLAFKHLMKNEEIKNGK